MFRLIVSVVGAEGGRGPDHSTGRLQAQRLVRWQTLPVDDAVCRLCRRQKGFVYRWFGRTIELRVLDGRSMATGRSDKLGKGLWHTQETWRICPCFRATEMDQEVHQTYVYSHLLGGPP